ncbi:hypothetical protein BC939DRAFT_506608 [Gamsiella multidivaricata]|uniref:uncharacterized protein n=1 Tax=Gamsiella multidivaricata TaxID=101098 RepID=UPI00221E9A14|nr:uncharacterized protein BC939DRAFT_506608 [Gamsiella multidivaricata]KAG0365943.1 hypothetical protein BGZ54_006008 [Gamsiella multidivaricata]KAI7818427.1 hypothetical protein BC939DRAFT_506608 [Gamsiella multidivaricata]
MDTILQLYSKDTTGAALRQFFEENDSNLESQDQISDLIVESLTQEWSFGGYQQDSDRLLLVRAILRASPEDEEGSKRRSQVLKGAISWLVKIGENTTAQSRGSGPNYAQVDELAGKLTNMIIDVGQSFDQSALVQSIYTMTEVVRHQKHPHAQMFALLSRLLVISASVDSVLLSDTSEEISGAEFRDITLDRICTAPWNQKSVLPLAIAMADIEMESKQLEMVIVKIMKQFKHVDATDLPVLIYNLLLLSSKGHQRLVIRGTLEFFDRLNAGGAMVESLRSNNSKGAARLAFSELSAIESTVILHFSFAIKQDQELGTEFLKHMKGGKTAYLSSFALACLMTMAKIHRFQNNVMDYIKSSILSTYRDMERMRSEPWVSDFQGMSPPPILEMFRNVIRKIPFGLEQLTPSIVQCGVYIMDSMAPSSIWKASDKDTTRKHTPKTPGEFGCELGATILAETFKTQPSARTEILDHIMSRIVTKSTSTVFFLELLESIVKDSAEALEEHLPRIKESLEYLSFLSLSTAVRLMAAVRDVAKLNRPFRDSLILILRKALFSKTLESRQVALSGFLLLLEPSSKSQPSLQGGSSRLGAHQSSENELPRYSMEILGMLRRCLGQQGEVRHSLYIGLIELAEIAPSLNPVIFEILQAHFVHFYDPTGTRLSPLKLEECVSNSTNGGEPTFVEPLHYLMSGVVRSLVGLQKLKRRTSFSPDEIYPDEHQITECHRNLGRIVLGLQRAGLEDFELDRTSDFNMATNIGARNNMYATLLTGCYESAVEYVVLNQQSYSESSTGKSVASDRYRLSDYSLQTAKMSIGSSEVILELFSKMHKLHDIVKEKVVMPRNKKLGPLGESSVLGLECVTRLMEFMYAGRIEGESPDEEVLKLRSNDDFLHTSSEKLKDSEYDYCRRLSSVLVREFLVSERPDGPKAMAAGAKGKDKNKSLLMVGIEALTAGLLTLQRFYGVEPSSSMSPGSPESLCSRKVVSNFLAATLPQANGAQRHDQQASEVVAWTTSQTIRYDFDSLAAAYVRYLQELVVSFVNETIPLLKEAGGLLGMIRILSRYLSRPSGVPDGADGAEASADSSALSRASSAVSAEFVAPGMSHLDQLIHWLVKFCRDQAVDDTGLTKTLLSMMLQLEQECANPQMNAELLATVNGQNGAELPAVNRPMVSGSLGFGSVSASSAISHCPEAAIRLRLAADVLLTYGMNYSGPQVSSLRDLPNGVAPGEEVDEDTMRWIRLKQEIGVESLLAVVTLRTSGAITEVLLQQVDRSLEGLEWALAKLRYCGLTHSGSDGWNTKESTNGDRLQQHAPRPQAANHPRSSSPLISLLSPTDTKTPYQPDAERNTNNAAQILAKRSLQEFETEICWRVEICLWVLARIAQACINQSSSEHLIRVLQRCYKVLTALTKSYLTPLNSMPLNIFSAPSSLPSSSTASKSSSALRKATAGNNVIQLPHGFLRVTQVAGMELSRHLYSFLSYFQMLDVEQKARTQERGGGHRGTKKADKDKDQAMDGRAPKFAASRRDAIGSHVGGVVKSRQKAKILRESKLIPMLIFAVEQYERYVIQLSKKAKVNLTQFMRRSTARDFRIQIQRLGELGLEDRYDEERQQMMVQRQLEQQQLQQLQEEGAQDGDTDMMYDHDEGHAMALHAENEADKEEEEEVLVRSRKRAKYDD